MIWNIVYWSILAFTSVFSVALIPLDKVWRKGRKAQSVQITDKLFSLVLVLLGPANVIFCILATIYSFTDTTVLFIPSLLFSYFSLSGCFMTPLDCVYYASRKKQGFGTRFYSPTLYEAELDACSAALLSFLYYWLTLAFSKKDQALDPLLCGILLLFLGLSLLALGLFALRKKSSEERISWKETSLAFFDLLFLLAITWIFPLSLIALLGTKNQTVCLVFFCLSSLLLVVYLLLFNQIESKKYLGKESLMTLSTLFYHLRLFSLGISSLFLVLGLAAFLASLFLSL